MDTESAKRRDDIMRKVTALLAKADSTTFSEERDSLVKKADELMTIYAINSFELEFGKPKSERRKAELREINYGSVGNSELDAVLSDIFYAMAEHVRCKLGWYGWRSSKVVGYPEDLDWLEMLFLNVRLHLATQLEPKPDRNLRFVDNVAMLKEAGLKWERIYAMLWPVFPDEFPQSHKIKKYDYERNEYVTLEVPTPPEGFWERKIGVKFTKIYTDHCKAEDRERTYSNPDVYRRNFTQAYGAHIVKRLREMDAANREATSGKELVLQSMADDLLEALYDFFPEKRPHPTDCDCDRCHYCTDTECKRKPCVDRRKPVKFRNYRSVKEKVFDASAAAAGRPLAQPIWAVVEE